MSEHDDLLVRLTHDFALVDADEAGWAAECASLYEICAEAASAIRSLLAERDALRGRVHEALGFAFAFACQRLDDGHDPRNIKVPLLLEAWNSALAAWEER